MSKVLKRCMVCKQEFIGHFNAKICGNECRLNFRRKYQRLYRSSFDRSPQEPEVFEPFPPHIDREWFGHWLSGFADGEATFGLRVAKQGPKIAHQGWFRITLRDDDTEVLRLIQRYWSCGIISFQNNARSKITNAKPIACYSVQKVATLMDTVIAHFGHFPLRSKKRNDFAVWRRGIELMAEVQGRPKIGRIVEGGILPSWGDSDRDLFLSLSETLANQRQYAASTHA